MLDRTPLKDRAKGRWHEILVGVGISSKFLVNRHGPCPVCGGKDRFRFDDKDGRGTFYCSQCGPGDGIELVKRFRSLEFPEAAIEIESVIGSDAPRPSTAEPPPEDTASKYEKAKEFWRTGRAIEAGDAVYRYLVRRLGRAVATRALRTIPATPFGGSTHSAMISAYVDVHGDLAGIQRTFLTPQGQKVKGLEADRWNTGSLPDGGAIRLVPHQHRLGIAEGVETALSAGILFNMPVWAALNENRLEVWQPPQGVTEVVVFGDNDLNCVGQAAAYALGKRLNNRRERDIIAQVAIPPDAGTDWNDVLQVRLGGRAEDENMHAA